MPISHDRPPSCLRVRIQRAQRLSHQLPPEYGCIHATVHATHICNLLIFLLTQICKLKLRSCFLPPRYLVRDMLGRGLLRRMEPPSGTVYRLAGKH